MSVLAYLIRSPAQTISHSLYFPDDPNIVVLGIEDAVSIVDLSKPAEVLQSGDTFLVKTGERLTYKQLLDVIIKIGKIVIL